MENNQALFSPSPSRPGELRDESEEPGVSERRTRSGPALWNSPPPRRYDGGQPQEKHNSLWDQHWNLLVCPLPGLAANLGFGSSKDAFLGLFFYCFVREQKLLFLGMLQGLQDSLLAFLVIPGLWSLWNGRKAALSNSSYTKTTPGQPGVLPPLVLAAAVPSFESCI